MPIYEYQCAACGHRYECLQKLNEPPVRDCPECGRPDLVKLVTAAGFRLAGSGWYETDFKTGDKRNLAAGSGQQPAADKDNKDKAAGKDKKKPEPRVDGQPAAGKPATSPARK